ncbi:MAG: M1 family metallopeptidase, partial [bacterium]
MNRFLNTILCICFFSLLPSTLLSQRLPEGAYHANRERNYAIIHYKADLSLDFEKQKVTGTAAIRLTPLREIRSFALDAIGLHVKSVKRAGSNANLAFKASNHALHIDLPQKRTARDTFSVVVEYECTPRAGMYFVRNPADQNLFFLHTYGEDGLHANWLPIYSDVNDKFSTEMLVTVPEPYTVVSNGVLVEKRKQPDGRTTFHWLQKLPHSNYLISIYAGDFEKGELRPAFGKIPMAYWVPRGRLAEGAYTFRNTTRMVEFFSKRFDYTYPWDKYDQIVIPDYAVGAMEHTGVTGHEASLLREKDAPLDFSPALEHYSDPWSAEAIISHELAHHWFGDLLTCRNLSYIWLNESFASHLMMLWDEESLGKDQLLLDVQMAKDRYFEYVRSAHIIRPLEYHNFDDANTIYNTEHTYLKGAAVLHSLRKILGDEPYFRALSFYLHKHAFDNVISSDLKIAIEEATGENLDWFFAQWVTGGGHPRFEVKYEYLDSRKKITLEVAQVQPLVEGQGIFDLPVKITIATPSKTWQEKVWLEKANARFLFASDEKPLMVSFDGEGDLVAEIAFPKNAEELAYQALHDAVPGKIRAIRQLAAKYPISQQTYETFAKILLSSDEFWGVQAEAALQLGTLRTGKAESLIQTALEAKDYRVRKAAVLALAKFGTTSAIQQLENINKNDPHSDVVAAAILALAKSKPALEATFIKKQLQRDAWYDEIRYAALLACKEQPSPS